jgi:hypothetical protein
MSLINDALKRAKAAQENNPPPSSPQLEFRPATNSGKGSGLLVPATVTAVVVGGVITWWVFNHSRRDSALARVPVEQNAAAPIAPETPPAAPTNAVDASLPAPVALAVSAHVTPSSSTNTPTPAPLVQAEKITPPRLQAVLYNPARPSAIVGGRTVFVGDRIREYRVVRITADSVTLVSPTSTNVLTLE